MNQRKKVLPTFFLSFDFCNEDGGSLFQKENSSFMIVLSEWVPLRMMIKSSNFMTVQFNLPQLPPFIRFSVRQSLACIWMTLKTEPKTQQEENINFLL